MLQLFYKFPLRILILFGFLITYHITPYLTSRYLSLAVAIFVIFYRRDKLKYVMRVISKKKLKHSFILILSCTLLLLVSNALSTGSFSKQDVVIEWWHFPYQFFFIFILSLYCAVEYESLGDFLFTWVLFIVIESVLVYLAVSFDSIRLFFYLTSYVGDGRFDATIETGTRIMGFGIYASDGSLTMSTGIVSLILLKLKNKINDLIFVSSTIIVFSATLFIGRTGVLVEILLILGYILLSRRFRFTLLFAFTSVIVIPFVITYFLSYLSLDSSDRLQEWMIGAFTEENQMGTLQTATRSGLQFNEYFLFGNAGLMRGHYNGYTYNSDSGYLKMITAVGIVGALMYYYSMFLLFLSVKRIKEKKINMIVYLLIIIAFLVEIKEPYFMKLRIPWFFCTVILLNSIEEWRCLNLKVIGRKNDR